jgi:hypothetical protein
MLSLNLPFRASSFQPSSRVVFYVSIPWLLSPFVALQVLSQLHPFVVCLSAITFNPCHLLIFTLMLILYLHFKAFSLPLQFESVVLPIPSMVVPLLCRFASLASTTSFVVLMLLSRTSCSSPRLSTTLESSYSLFKKDHHLIKRNL